MKKSILFLVLVCLIVRSLFGSDVGPVEQAKRTFKLKREASFGLLKNRNFEEDLPISSESTSVGTPRVSTNKLDIATLTPRSREKYFLPYFFDGTVQYVFLKKIRGFRIIKKSKTSEDGVVSLIPLEEKNDFIEKIQDFFDYSSKELIVGNNLVLIRLKAVKDVLEQNYGDYTCYKIDDALKDNDLSENQKKNLQIIQKTVLFIPLFYQLDNQQVDNQQVDNQQVDNQQLKILIKQSVQEKQEQNLINQGLQEQQETKLKFLIRKTSTLSEHGLKKEVEEEINNIMIKKFKILQSHFYFLPTIISESNTMITCTQPINATEAEMYSIGPQNEYISLYIQDILKPGKVESSIIVEMRGYLKNLHSTLKSERYEKEKIDQSFIKLFIKEYDQYKEDVKARLAVQKSAAIEERIKTEAEEARKKEQVLKVEQKRKELEEKRAANPVLPEEQAVERNVVPAEVKKGEQEEQKQKRQKIEEWQRLKTAEGQAVKIPSTGNEPEIKGNVENQERTIEVAEKMQQEKVDESEIQETEKNVPEFKTEKREETGLEKRPRAVSSAKIRKERLFPSNLDFYNQIIAFVTHLFDMYSKKKVTNKELKNSTYVCSENIISGLSKAQIWREGQVWVALPLKELKDVIFDHDDDYESLSNGDHIILQRGAQIDIIPRKGSFGEYIAFIFFVDKELKEKFHESFKRLQQQKKLKQVGDLYIGIKNFVNSPPVSLCKETNIIIASVDLIKKCLENIGLRQNVSKKISSIASKVFPGLIKETEEIEMSKKVTDEEKTSSNVEDMPVEQIKVDVSEKISPVVFEQSKQVAVVGSAIEEPVLPIAPIQLDQTKILSVTQYASISNPWYVDVWNAIVQFFTDIGTFFKELIFG